MTPLDAVTGRPSYEKLLPVYKVSPLTLLARRRGSTAEVNPIIEKLGTKMKPTR